MTEYPHAQLRATLSADLADRSLPKHARDRLTQLLNFVDKIGNTPLPQNLTPVALTVGDRLHAPAQLPPRPSLLPDGMQIAPAVEPFPSE